MSSAVEQCRDGFQFLSDYFLDVQQYLSDGVTLPDPFSLYDSLSFEELLTHVITSMDSSADFSIGASIESVNHFVGVERELSMVESGKTAIYLSAISEAKKESDFLTQNSTFLSNVISGAPTNGSQC